MIKINSVMYFPDHYQSFLGILGSGPRCTVRALEIISSGHRNYVYNNYVRYAAIVSKGEHNNIVLSIDPDGYKNALNFLSRNLPHIDVSLDGGDLAYETLKNVFPDLPRKRMYRFSSPFSYHAGVTSAVPLIDEMKELYISSLSPEKTVSQKEKKWDALSKYRNNGHCFVLIHNHRIVSISTISDIFLGSGNITVNTFKGYCQRGYGREVMLAAIHWCIAHKIVPVYAVYEENQPSVSLAESLGLQKYADELVVPVYQ